MAARHATTNRAQRTLVAVAVACAAAIAAALGLQATLWAAPAGGDQSAPFLQPGLRYPSGGSDPSTAPSIATTAETTPAAAVPTKPAPTTAAKPPPPAAPSHADVAQAVLDQLNAWRAEEGRAPLTMTAGLVASAHKHNLRMAAGCGLSHQCPGEATFSARITAEGVRWSAVAENVATQSSAANTTAAILAAAKRLNQAMHDERPPEDGHRRNMLNEAYHRVGIDVIRDAQGRVWLTQDFAN